MSYRVEQSVSGRAVCKDTVCKEHGLKIGKDELRFGSWVETKDFQSWSWKHWGCISGKQLQNLRTYLEDPAKPGTYRWDMLDGYEDGGKGGLDNAPDLQEKVRRVITQGFVDAEDWNGDAEMNVLGAVGTRSNETKKRLREEKKEADLNPPSELEEEAPPKEKKKATGKKRKAEAEEDEHVEETNPVKKKRVSKAKKEESDDEVMPAKKKRASKAKKEESDDEVLPAKKARAPKTVKDEIKNKDEDDFDAPIDLSAPKKRASKSKKVKDEPAEEEDAVEKAPPKKSRGKKVKDEPVEEEDAVEKAPAKGNRSKKVKNEPVEEEEAAPVKAKSKKGRSKKAVKEEEPALEAPALEDDDSMADIEQPSSPVAPAPAKGRGGRRVKSK